MTSHELPKDTAPSETYEANCHCGWITYAVTLSPPLYDGLEVLNCNCSICTRNGYLLVYPKRDKIKWHGDSLSRVGKYQFNTMKKDHLFCPHCATSLMIDFNGVYENWDVLAVNVRPFKDIDISKLTLEPDDGKKNMDPPGDHSGRWHPSLREEVHR